MLLSLLATSLLASSSLADEMPGTDFEDFLHITFDAVCGKRSFPTVSEDQGAQHHYENWAQDTLLAYCSTGLQDSAIMGELMETLQGSFGQDSAEEPFDPVFETLTSPLCLLATVVVGSLLPSWPCRFIRTPPWVLTLSVLEPVGATSRSSPLANHEVFPEDGGEETTFTTGMRSRNIGSSMGRTSLQVFLPINLLCSNGSIMLGNMSIY